MLFTITVSIIYHFQLSTSSVPTLTPPFSCCFVTVYTDFIAKQVRLYDFTAQISDDQLFQDVKYWAEVALSVPSARQFTHPPLSRSRQQCIRALVKKHQRARHQQRCMLRRILKRYPVLLLHLPDPVEDGIPVRIHLPAGLLQRMMATQIGVQRQTVQTVLVPVTPSHRADRRQDQVPSG